MSKEGGVTYRDTRGSGSGMVSSGCQHDSSLLYGWTHFADQLRLEAHSFTIISVYLNYIVRIQSFRGSGWPRVRSKQKASSGKICSGRQKERMIQEDFQWRGAGRDVAFPRNKHIAELYVILN